MLALIVDDKTKHQFLKLSHTLQILRHIQRLIQPPPPYTLTPHIYVCTHTHTHSDLICIIMDIFLQLFEEILILSINSRQNF